MTQEELRMKPTKKQISYAENMTKRMCQELPKVYTKKAYSDFIEKWNNS